MNKKTLKDIDVKNKKVLVRVDYNVPIENGKVSDDLRIRSSFETINYLLDNNASIILMSHLGRPKGERKEEFSLKPVADRLTELIGKQVIFVPDCIGETAESLIKNCKIGDIILLENLRFYKQETENDIEFAKKLASYADIYVSDAFGTVHRKHASVYQVAKLLKPAVAGFLVEKEIEYLSKAMDNPRHPFAVILGGAKVSDKIKFINNLIDKVDKILIGGGMAYTFLKALGQKIGSSICENDMIDTAIEILEKAKRLNKKIILPEDIICADRFANDANIKICKRDIEDGWEGLDIGPQTIERFSKELEGVKTILWNGPLGVFEFDNFFTGTKKIIEKIAGNQECVSIIGGGDTASAVKKSGYASKMSHISTGGGASLKFFEGDILPGIDALDNK